MTKCPRGQRRIEGKCIISKQKPTYSKETTKMLKERKGYRCEGYSGTGHWKLIPVFDFEVNKLGNDSMVDEACEFLDIDKPCDFAKVIDEMRRRYGNNGNARWLATKKDARDHYCEGEEPEPEEIPPDAVVISDLSSDGALFAWGMQ